MKFLECQELVPFNQALDRKDNGNYIIHGKIELYSCKPAREDKKLNKQLEQQFNNNSLNGQHSQPTSIVSIKKEIPQPVLSPPSYTLPASPFGPMTDVSSRKTLAFLISTLNSSFPDYDFGSVKGRDFTKEQYHDNVINSINLHLRDCMTDEQRAKLWLTLEKIVDIKSCDIYSFQPDPDSDPVAVAGKL
jgi:hypothetical protein